MSLKIAICVVVMIAIPCYARAYQTNSSCAQKDSSCSSPQKNPNLSFEKIPLKFDRAINGETFIAGDKTIKVWGIESPKIGDPAYKISTWLLGSILKDQIISCQLISLDKNEISVMQCFVEKVDVASTMVKFGMAKDFKETSKGYYKLEEDEAKTFSRGIWSIKNKPKNDISSD